MPHSSTPRARKPARAEAFTRLLLAWYARAARDLPWRRTRDPYKVLVSEFMLQQTQVSRVADYYPRFVARFPDLSSLARAPARQVREAWEGLGYYARAKHLHALARSVARSDSGTLPRDPEEREARLAVQSGDDGARGGDLRGAPAQVPALPCPNGVSDRLAGARLDRPRCLPYHSPDGRALGPVALRPGRRLRDRARARGRGHESRLLGPRDTARPAGGDQGAAARARGRGERGAVRARDPARREAA